MNDQQRWDAVLNRDTACEDAFVYAVKTTGIYCRPTCPSRRPHRENVAFFTGPADAEAAGYRACKRCHPNVDGRVEPNADLMVQVCRYLEEDHERIPTLEVLSERFGLSPYHLQRTFKRVVGVSPRQYADAHRQGRLRDALREGAGSVTDAAYAAGYTADVYKHIDNALGMTPVHYREGGTDAAVTYTVTPCKLGAVLVAATERGLCKISLGDDETTLTDELRAELSGAALTRDDAALGAWVSAVVAYIDGEKTVLDLPLDVRATGFQRKVWEALRAIPYGETRSYDEVAAAIGQPTATRAVAGACARNPVALAIPCHRVVRKGGSLSGYRWGVARKRAILETEAG